MTTITEQLDRLQALCDKATPGPWVVGFSDRSGSGEHGGGCYIVDNDDPCRVIVRGGESEGVPVGVESKPDAEFCAASRQAMPQLIAALLAIVEQNQRRGYPTGAEWTQLLDRIQQLLEGLWK